MKICCDIDGVLADVRPFVQRYLPHDWNDYFKHTEEFPVIYETTYLLSAFKAFHEPDNEAIFVTGRPESNRKDTKWWLELSMPFLDSASQLLMRKNGDFRHTYQIKMQWFRELKPDLIIDDDPLVAEAATKEGFIVLQVHGFRTIGVQNGTPHFSNRKENK